MLSAITLNVISRFCFAIILAFATSGFAANSAKSRADLTIREIASIQVHNNIYRVIKGFDEIYPFLVIEKIQLPLTEGDSAILSKSWELHDLAGIKALLPLKEGEDIRDIEWRQKTLEFKVHKESQLKKCQVINIAEGLPTLSCEPWHKKK